MLLSQTAFDIHRPLMYSSSPEIVTTTHSHSSIRTELQQRRTVANLHAFINFQSDYVN
jgi:hypothetical protein